MKDGAGLKRFPKGSAGDDAVCSPGSHVDPVPAGERETIR